MTRKLLLDTDIGTDVDDCLALALILASPEIELLGVTTVYGDVLLRSRMVIKLLRLRGVGPIPVVMGARRPLLARAPVYWEGHEGAGLLGPGDEQLLTRAGRDEAPDQAAASFIVHTVMAHPGAVTLLAIGPLTNVALAFLLEPRLGQALAGLTIMGGAVGGARALHLPWCEHNFKCDPEAAQIVLAAGAPVTIVPLDVTTKVRIRSEDVAAIEAAGDPFHLAVADQVQRYPRFSQRGGWTYLHDPLAAATVLAPNLVHTESLHAIIETGGEHSAGRLLVALPSPDTPPTAHVALGVDAARAERFIIRRLIH